MKKCRRRRNYRQTEEDKSEVKGILEKCVVYLVKEVFSLP